MIIINDIGKLNIAEETAVAIGKFDGIHLGHMKIFQELKKAKEKGLKTVVFSFTPSPSVFFGLTDDRCLMTDHEKQYFMEKMDIDYLIQYPFNRESSQMAAEDFIKIVLVNGLNMRFIVAGSDVSFGYKGAGDINLLQHYSAEYNYETVLIDKYKIDDVVVSSSLVRGLLTDNRIEEMITYLGHGYYISGEIKKGNSIGNTIGFPTINFIPEENKLLPCNGVYFSRIYLGNIVKNGITNIGCKPTVSDEKKITVETFIFDFNRDVYGQYAVVELLHFVRAEKKFDNIDSLKKAIEQDRENAAVYFE